MLLYFVSSSACKMSHTAGT